MVRTGVFIVGRGEWVNRDYSEVFDTTAKKKLIDIYHTYDNNKHELWSKMLKDIDNNFNVKIDTSDVERFRSWFKRVRRDMDNQYMSPSVSVFASDEKMAIEVERVKLRDQKNALKEIIRSQSRFEHLRECIMLGAKEVSKHKPLTFRQNIKASGHKEAALLLSDWHVGLQDYNFMNAYDVAECKNRLTLLVERVIQFTGEHKVKALHIFDLGDLISGNICNSIRVASNEDVVSQVMIACELFAEVISVLANKIHQVKVYSVTDNHSRILPNKNDVAQKDSYARFIPWYLEARLAKFNNVEIISGLDDEIAVADILGHTIFAIHGHRDSVKNVVANLTLMIKKFPDFVFLGHYHHNVEDEVHGCDIVVNPSLVGAEEYCKGIRRTSKPAQKLLIFTEDGRECTYVINLTGKKQGI